MPLSRESGEGDEEIPSAKRLKVETGENGGEGNLQERRRSLRIRMHKKPSRKYFSGTVDEGKQRRVAKLGRRAHDPYVILPLLQFLSIPNGARAASNTDQYPAYLLALPLRHDKRRVRQRFTRECVFGCACEASSDQSQRPWVAGIAAGKEGAYSVALSGGQLSIEHTSCGMVLSCDTRLRR